jgi:hypothetical protein
LEKRERGEKKIISEQLQYELILAQAFEMVEFLGTGSMVVSTNKY